MRTAPRVSVFGRCWLSEVVWSVEDFLNCLDASAWLCLPKLNLSKPLS